MIKKNQVFPSLVYLEIFNITYKLIYYHFYIQVVSNLKNIYIYFFEIVCNFFEIISRDYFENFL